LRIAIFRIGLELSVGKRKIISLIGWHHLIIWVSFEDRARNRIGRIFFEKNGVKKKEILILFQNPGLEICSLRYNS